MKHRAEHLAEGVRLILGDCREVLPTLGKVDAVVTDPPYGIEGTWDGGNSYGWGKLSGQAKPWDIRPEWFAEWISNLDCPIIIWGGQYFPLQPSGSWLIWDKVVREFSSGHAELAWTNLRKPIRAFNAATCLLANEGKLHPTQKPLELMKWCLGFVLRPGTMATILDPFMGSGTTGVAAVKLGRKFIGIENEPKYFDIACRRIQAALDSPDMFINAPKPAKQEAFEL